MADLEESGIYELTCRSGHRTAFCLQNFKFELLFDVGLEAVADGYYREAVSAFASALERFYEFYVDVALAGAGISPQAYQEAWKTVQNQSERQLGAFVFVFTREEGSAPQILSQKKIEIRNDAVHKGKFPTREQTISFGREVQDIIRTNLDRLRGRLDSEVHERRQLLLATLRAKAPQDFSIVSLYQMTFISASEEKDRHRFDIEEQIDAILGVRGELS